jgi:glycosyltransferase involved in cell wall biosynthesis
MDFSHRSPLQAKYNVTVVIPTYKRAEMLPYMIAALKRQTYKNFDLVVVVKPSGDGTEELLKHESGPLKINIVTQTQGYIVDAYFSGIKQSTGDIVALLDDDALPADNWLEETVKIFKNTDFTGVTGDSFPVLLKKGQLKIIEEAEIPCILSNYEFAFFGHPPKGA